MRRLLLLLLPLVGACFDFDFRASDDPCAGHGISGGLFSDADCACPLASEIGPALEGEPCATRGLSCSAGAWGDRCSCEQEPLRWSCGAADLSISAPPPDLAGAASD
jgi:hypothetical protein